MKLEGELAFFHSNPGLEHESQSFQFNDDDLGSTGCKSQNHKVKEYENRVSIDLKRNEGDSDLSPCEMESADCMSTTRLDFPKGMIDLRNGYEAQVKDFVEPVSHPSKEIESFRMFRNDMESVKRSSNTPIPDPQEEINSSEDSADIYMEESVTECEPEMVVCSNETQNHIIKDICVDEGGPTKDKILVGSTVHEKIYNFFPSQSYENKDTTDANIGGNVLNPPATEKSEQVSANHDLPKDLMQKVEDATEKLADTVYKEMVVPGDQVLLQDLDTEKSRPSSDEGDEIEHSHAKVAGEPELHSHPNKSKTMIEEAAFSSPALELAADILNNDILDSDRMLPDNESIAYQFDPLAPATCGKEESCQVGNSNCDETQNASRPADVKSDDQEVTSQVYQRFGESSFSSIGPVSSRISYSGPVPYSGSISLRSDSSTTSTRSFAFPVLQSEWNSSPVRMAKPDRRHYGKQRGWRQGLLCCRF